MSKNKFKIFNPFYLECHMTLSTELCYYVSALPPVETGGYSQATPKGVRNGS